MTGPPVVGIITHAGPPTPDPHTLAVHAVPLADNTRVQYVARCRCLQWDAIAVGVGVRAARFVHDQHDQHRKAAT